MNLKSVETRIFPCQSKAAEQLNIAQVWKYLKHLKFQNFWSYKTVWSKSIRIWTKMGPVEKKKTMFESSKLESSNFLYIIKCC